MLSPSNRKAEIEDKKELCLANGCLEFWVIDPKRLTIEVAAGQQVHRYREGDLIDLIAIPGKSIQVSEVFNFEF